LQPSEELREQVIWLSGPHSQIRPKRRSLTQEVSSLLFLFLVSSSIKISRIRRVPFHLQSQLASTGNSLFPSLTNPTKHSHVFFFFYKFFIDSSSFSACIMLPRFSLFLVLSYDSSSKLLFSWC
jgi:hypothetical protein